MPLEVALGLQNYTLVRALLVAGCSISNSTVPVTASEARPLNPVPWLQLHNEALDYIRTDQDELTWFSSFLRSPASLRQLCRRSVRRLLGTPLHAKLIQLDGLVPRALIDFLAMTDIQTDILK